MGSDTVAESRFALDDSIVPNKKMGSDTIEFWCGWKWGIKGARLELLFCF